MARSTCPGPTRSPAVRSVRAKCTMLVASLPLARIRRGRRFGQRVHHRVAQPSGSAAMSDFTLRRISAASEPCRRWMSSWYFSSTPSVSLMVVGIEVERVQLRQRRRPVDRLGDARRLEEVELAQLLHEADDLARQALAGARRLDLEDLQLALQVGIVDPVIEAAALQRVVDLARAVGGDDDDRRLRRLDRAELGNRHLEVGQHFQQVGLERLVGAVELVDQQDRRAFGMRAAAPRAAAGGSGTARRRCRPPAGRDRARPAPRPAGSRSSGARSSTRRPRRRRRGPRSTAGGSADASASAASTLAISVLPTPASPSQNSGRPELEGEVEDGGEAAVGDIVAALQKLDGGVDRCRRGGGHATPGKRYRGNAEARQCSGWRRRADMVGIAR